MSAFCSRHPRYCSCEDMCEEGLREFAKKWRESDKAGTLNDICSVFQIKPEMIKNESNLSFNITAEVTDQIKAAAFQPSVILISLNDARKTCQRLKASIMVCRLTGKKVKSEHLKDLIV